MDKEVQVYESKFGKVRVVMIDGVPWFVGKDIADNLGYAETAKAIREHVDNEDKGVSVLDTPGGKQKMIIQNAVKPLTLVMGI